MNFVDLCLSDTETDLFNKLSRVRDAPISVLFRVVRKRWPLPSETRRRQQQVVGASISRLNRKLAGRGFVVAPGVRRSTYRLKKIPK